MPKWLDEAIAALDMRFSWEVSDAEFSSNETIQVFVRSTEASMSMKELVQFKDIQAARNYAVKWMREKRVDALFLKRMVMVFV
ncbi:hypothetical protein GN244_ATG10845 [Phytophthora infestans]|uniref:Uncharacterized protein n=1 Tax=Phytophthora infestans TaxID=4787 RepID=A0A833WTT7_PHYIN|nr:hypothetical protein GN244_ATG10845 [Phytophthora infestans]